MATRLDFHLVDVFARERYAGNQLAVVEVGGQVVPVARGGLLTEPQT